MLLTEATDGGGWTARANAADVDPADREQLRAAAEDAARRADELELQVAQLEYTDRARLYMHNAATAIGACCEPLHLTG